ncbi:MAG: DUF2332 domain-containing protein [Ilumatobacteraceae bacterium]
MEPPAVERLTDLRQRFLVDAREHRRRAPFHSALCAAAASDPEILAILRHAPTEQQVPVLLMAAVHSVVLAEPSLDLAAHYPTTGGDASAESAIPAFVDFCHDEADRLGEIVATHRTQTNEVGRASLLLPGLALVHAEVGPIGMLDVGTSGGLNLLLDRFRYEYRPGGSIGSESTVHLVCDVEGDVPLPSSIPTLASRLGTDIDPIDVTDDERARWLLACIWPDQLDRFERVQAAIELARVEPVPVIRSDAVEAVTERVRAMDGHPVVTNSWVLNYLSDSDRIRYVDALDRIGHEIDLSWVYAECPALCPGVPFAGPARDRRLTSVTMVTWRGGDSSVRHIGSAHPHGYWLRGRQGD